MKLYDSIGPNPRVVRMFIAEKGIECRMWTRRVDLNICEHLGNGYRFGEGFKFFQSRIPCAPEASPGLKMIAANRLQWLDGQMVDKDYLCGKRFTLADILLYCWIDFVGQVGQPLNAANSNIVAWFTRVGQRPSVKA
jgi:glutathione S-transferase